MGNPKMEPSSADRGFFQQEPQLKNQFHDDISFRRVMKREWQYTGARAADCSLANVAYARKYSCPLSSSMRLDRKWQSSGVK